MAQEQKHGVRSADEVPDETTLLKKRARRRLIGAVALALLAAIVLPMVMDHEPAMPVQDIQVRIPSPDEGVAQRIAPPLTEPASSILDRAPAAQPEPVAQPLAEPADPVAPAPHSASPQVAAPRPAQATQPEQAAQAAQQAPSAQEIKRAEEALAGRVPPPAEQWEVRLGAYQNPASVANLVKRLEELGIPTFTEKVDTPKGPRTRVRAGPFPTREAAEQARTRVRIVGVDGPVERKP